VHLFLQVVAAPTGSGKTGVMELAILRLLSKRISPDGTYDPPAGAVKVVYLAPMRALVQEKVKSWQDRCGGSLVAGMVMLSVRAVGAMSLALMHIDVLDAACALTPGAVLALDVLLIKVFIGCVIKM
jgi:hypothetical protein